MIAVLLPATGIAGDSPRINGVLNTIAAGVNMHLPTSLCRYSSNVFSLDMHRLRDAVNSLYSWNEQMVEERLE